MKYKPSRDLPRFVREYRTLSPSALREIVLRERNRAVTPESITNWFRRHSQIREDLRKEVVQEEFAEEEVHESIFQKGVFEELGSVRAWILDMRRRDLGKRTVDGRISYLKSICQGKMHNKGIDLTQKGWAYKHPDRLTLDDATRFIDLMKMHYPEIDLANMRVTSRNFLTSKRIVVGSKISGVKSKSFGKYADLYVEKSILKEMLEWIRSLNEEAYRVDLFMFKTATRIDASLQAKIENMSQENDHRCIKVYDKGRRSKYPQGHPWNKYVDDELFEVLKESIRDRKFGLLFNPGISHEDLSKINRSAIEKFCPEVLQKYGSVMPNHFWRHMFAQHMLRATGWNYGVVASLGGWTVQSLEESYGKPPHAEVQKWGLRFIPEI